MDMIVVVEDPHDFHVSNFAMNNSHYSGLAKRFPIAVICGMQERGGIYFHPLVTVDSGHKIKYGVVGKS